MISNTIEHHLKNRSPFTRSQHQNHNFSTIRKPYHAPGSSIGGESASPLHSRQFAHQYAHKTNDVAPFIPGEPFESINNRQEDDEISKGERSEVNLNQSIYSNHNLVSNNASQNPYLILNNGDSSLIVSNSGRKSNGEYKNVRAIDRAAIFEEIQQSRIQEMRNQLQSNKAYGRKVNKANQISFSSQHNHLIPSSKYNISFKGGIGFNQGLTGETTASYTTYHNKRD